MLLSTYVSNVRTTSNSFQMETIGRNEKKDTLGIRCRTYIVASSTIFIDNSQIGDRHRLESSPLESRCTTIQAYSRSKQTLKRASRHPGRAAGVDPYRERCPYGLNAFLKSTTPASSSPPPATSKES